MTQETKSEVKTAESPKGETTEKVFTQAQVEAMLKEKTASLDRKITEQSKIIKQSESSRQEWQSEVQSLRSEMQMLAALAAEGRQPSELEEATPTQKGDLLRRYQEMRAQEDAKRVGEKYRIKVESLGITENDVEYHDILRDVQGGNLKGADVRIKRIEKAREIKEEPPKVEAPKESEEDRIARIAEEKARKILEERGQLTVDTGTPSTTSTLNQLSPKQLDLRNIHDLKWFREHEKEIDKLYREGKIKSK